MGHSLVYITGAFWLYIAWRVVWPLPYGLGTRLIIAALLFLAAEYHWVTSHYFGTLASPELPRWILIVLGWAFGCVLLLAMLSFVRDVLGIVVWLPWHRAGRALLAGRGLNQSIGALGLILAALGVWNAIKVPSVKTLTITLPQLPAAFDGYRIVQLSDTHASRLLPESWQAAVVARSNALQPDLIVITGDLADGTPQARAADVRPLHDLHAQDGVVAIPGNHEYYADYVNWMKAYRALGLTMLENQHVLIRRDGSTLALVGLTDRQAIPFGRQRPDLNAALDGVPDAATVILLQHRPDSARENAQRHVALQLSGHTHGGQILGPNLLTRRANDGFLSGLYRVGAMQLYVSNGTGLWNGLAIRLGVPSEITQIILKAP